MSKPVNDPAAIFRQEAADLLVTLEESLLDLEANPQDHALVDKVFRALHTIKGSGAMFGFTEVAEFTHHLENAFDQVRTHKQPVTRTLISLTLASRDHIRALIDQPDTADMEAATQLLAALGDGESAVHDAPPPPPPAPLHDGAPVVWRITFRPGREALAFGTNPLLLLNELRDLGETRIQPLDDGVPLLEDIEPADCCIGWDILLTTTEPRSAIEDVFIFVADESALTIEPVSPHPVGAAAPGARPETLPAMPVALAKAAPSPPLPANAATPAEAQTVRVQADRLDSLMDQVGELVIAQARLRQLANVTDDLNLRSVAEEIERLSSNLRDTTMSVRMLPIGTLFGRFRRLVRDLSQTLGRQVTLTMEGEETELDKTVIESLNDPLVHLIRNAIDHGIESAEARVAAGKPAEGHVHLAAVHSGAQVLITISDDGKGMNRDAIRRKAEEKGLLAPGADIADSDLLAFIFHPGFSTADKVSNVSGRGVGMDVVRQTIDALRGSIDVTSQPGQGSRVTLKLPLTLAIIDGLLIRVGQGLYVVPLTAVEEVVDLSAEQDLQSRGRTFLNIRDSIVPFVRLRELFASPAKAGPHQKVVIVTSGQLKVGLVVDQVIGQYQTVIKSLSKLLDDVEGFSGATILGDGSVALILDIAHLIDLAQEREAALKAS